MKRPILAVLLVTAYWTLVPFCGAANTTPSPTLYELLDIVLERADKDNVNNAATLRASSWLDGAPSVSMNYLRSQEDQGSDEAELRLNLPIKSFARRNADAQVRQNDARLHSANQRIAALFYSGLIRESIWSYKVAMTRLEGLNKKHRLLLELEQQFTQQVDAGITTTYGLLAAKQTRLSIEIEQLEQQQVAQRWLDQFQQLTGTAHLPDKVVEPPPDDGLMAMNNHPHLALLESERRQARLTLLNSRHGNEAWNLSVTAKQVDSPGFTDNQIGLGVEVPLSMGERVSQSDYSAWQQASRAFDAQLQQAHQTLLNEWKAVQQHWQYLNTKKRVLTQQQLLSSEILAQIKTLKNLNEIEQELFLKRAIDSIDMQQAGTLNQTLIEQQQARMNQAAGVSL
ncbi:TolC family protein [Lacimicrobium alkaliphilum]|uniref:TolC family protein n=1 Tax=Lacimicrobium alkaliphilum TaxID=1526571 RepID=A0ABQ1RCX7_9ALTE|nr:TolC family protein [Lacimicrobium alkaliphilum]GGD63741.1 hypothetical protein GCM10011357_18840 [Lacimicrobium alkaliphilum]